MTTASPVVACVVGARPNFMKIKPVIDALEARSCDTRLIHTGQHYDHSMSEVFFTDLGIRQPDIHLGVGSGTHAQQTAAVMVEFEKLLRDHRYEAVVVVGDVNSTLACAISGAKAGCLVAHVEAGLRSRDWDMPEEINRVATDRLSDLLFAPSADAVSNLEAEGYRSDQVHLVGNVMIDTLQANLDRARTRSITSDLKVRPKEFGLVTLHRPSNVDDASQLQALLGALTVIAAELPLVFPAHPRTRAMFDKLSIPSQIKVIEPLGYLDFLALQDSAAIVLTDSGGVQEETTALGVPCLTLRTSTERPITIDEGTNRLVGTDPNQIVLHARSVLADPPSPRRPALWDGKAGERIADVLTAALRQADRPRPTSLL